MFVMAGSLFAQQDMTAEWKTSLNVLERRASVLNVNVGTALEDWRTEGKIRRILAEFPVTTFRDYLGENRAALEVS